MLSRSEFAKAQARAARMLAAAGIVITKEERAGIEVADFGLGDLERTGLEIVLYANNDRYCAKELIMFGRQTCPEHRHPPAGGGAGKMETFRVYLYVEGSATPKIKARITKGDEKWYGVFHEVKLTAGQQYTIAPNTLHWFQAGERGAIVSEFSSTSRDESDVFTDARIRRVPEVEG
jgi:D-lyxose ketol-isomerase